MAPLRKLNNPTRNRDLVAKKDHDGLAENAGWGDEAAKKRGRRPWRVKEQLTWLANCERRILRQLMVAAAGAKLKLDVALIILTLIVLIGWIVTSASRGRNPASVTSSFLLFGMHRKGISISWS
jgi:hypothetical protein